jgi:hypothetical protein
MQNTSSYQITFVRPGRYLLDGSSRIFSIPSAFTHETAILYNGVGTELALNSRYSQTGDYATCQCWGYLNTNGGDYVQVFVRNYTAVVTYGINEMSHLYAYEQLGW